jgi:hypothetical protein
MEKEYEEVAFLIAQTGPLNGQRWALKKSTTMGRESTCDIVIPDRQVSRHHARFTLTLEGIILEDLDSKNGTHHNGQIVLNPILLQDGDVIQIALAQKFIFLSSDSTVPLDKEGIDLLEIHPSDSQFRIGEMPGRLKLDRRSRRVWINLPKGEGTPQENEILPPLSVSQFRLLEILYENQGQVISRQELGSAVWGENQAFEVSEQALDALVRRLRDRIANADPSHDYIVTVRGHGLRLENPPL